MPRLAKYKYTGYSNRLAAILGDAPNTGRPRKIDKAWLKSRGIAANSESVLSVLRSIGLTRNDDTTTDLWNTIKYPNPHNKVRFADAVRMAYADLFADFPDAHRKEDSTLRAWFQAQVEGQDQVQRKVLRTFRTLVRFGDFDTDPDWFATKTPDLPELVRSVEGLGNQVRKWLEEQYEIQAKLEALAPLHKRLDELVLEQDELLRDSFTAAEAGLFRASHVLAWSGFTDFLYKPFTIAVVTTVRPKIKTRDDLDRA
jgi:hypothetical protein